jgi:hypothetical protein
MGAVLDRPAKPLSFMPSRGFVYMDKSGWREIDRRGSLRESPISSALAARLQRRLSGLMHTREAFASGRCRATTLSLKGVPHDRQDAP